ncbi:hypothetical protein Plim_2947 [Planctopirus limnophila DSM 3776]|uniref:Uncharacterized protein n=1 Tax=Planctopirus limnophila (strain ATCC 43296 / DSM 3776 / IFAM 1008 / Mu 290) TaxID=521674 RepID=D5SS45_PLAL2|nr:hypothetical protein [Planctopirus limnophila]ADG68769.1 hypothetical protein Plim_2947 [Planctopirus limnophila DSM 3776]
MNQATDRRLTTRVACRLIFLFTIGYWIAESQAAELPVPAKSDILRYDSVRLVYSSDKPEFLPWHPSAKGSLYTVDFLCVDTNCDLKGELPDDMVGQIDTLRGSSSILLYRHSRLVTSKGVHCHESSGHFARVDNEGTIHRRRLDEEEDSHIWQFVGETYRVKLTAIEMGKVRADLLVSTSHLQGEPFRLHPEDDHNEPRWSLLLGTDKTTAELVLPDDKYMLISRSISSQKTNDIETVTYRYKFVRVSAFEQAAP